PNPVSPYAASKIAAEYYCRVYANTYGLPVRILRLFNVYGPGQSNEYAGVITQFLKTVSEGKTPLIYGSGKQTRDFIYVGDVVDAILASLRRRLPAGIVLNIASGKPLTISDLAKKVLRLLGREDLSPVYRRARQGDIVRSVADVSHARNKLGFQTSWRIDEGLKLTYSSMTDSQPN